MLIIRALDMVLSHVECTPKRRQLDPPADRQEEHQRDDHLPVHFQHVPIGMGVLVHGHMFAWTHLKLSTDDCSWLLQFTLELFHRLEFLACAQWSDKVYRQTSVDSPVTPMTIKQPATVKPAHR